MKRRAFFPDGFGVVAEGLKAICMVVRPIFYFYVHDTS